MEKIVATVILSACLLVVFIDNYHDSFVAAVRGAWMAIGELILTLIAIGLLTAFGMWFDKWLKNR